MIGIIVDGPGDYASFNARFKGKVKVLKTDGPRGHTARATDIISAARKQIHMLANLGCIKAAIVTDLEKRTQGYSSFVKELEKAIKSVEFPIPIFVAAADQMIENWYLADIERLSKSKTYIKDGLRQKNYEGKDGKRELRLLFKANHEYNEIKHGAELFKLIRTTIARTNSPSFDRLCTILGEKN